MRAAPVNSKALTKIYLFIVGWEPYILKLYFNLLLELEFVLV